MKSLSGSVLRKTPITAPPKPESKSEDQSLALGVVSAFFGLPDLSHAMDIIEHAEKLERKGFRKSQKLNLNLRESLDPRKALSPR